jgi:PAS domain S-box-containing protein
MSAQNGRPTYIEEHRLESLLEIAPDAMLIIDHAGRVVHANTLTERLFGYHAKELLGCPIENLIPERFRKEHRGHRADFSTQPRVRPMGAKLELFGLRKDGTEFPVEISLSPIETEKGLLVASAIRDIGERHRIITERKIAEHELLELNRALKDQTALLQSREELLRTFVKNAPVGVAMFDRDMRYLQVSDRWCEDNSLDSSQIVGRSHYEIVPDLPDRWKEIHRRGLEGETLRADEDRWDRDGHTRWIRWEIRPWWNLETMPGGILLLAEDITHRKQMEEALSDMTRKLVQAQEQERTRIARELHDDINQRLAMLVIGLGQLQGNPSEIRSRVQELRKQTTDISNDVQALSHDLHHSKLEYLGVILGMKSWCHEFGERQGLQIEFKCPESQMSLPPEVGLCLFRVLQEALHNAARHSGVKRFDVQLREDSGEIHLLVSDLGRGFDLETAVQGRGLGLTSMQERIRLVNGMIEIQSKPMVGTTVHVSVPLGSENASQWAAR